MTTELTISPDELEGTTANVSQWLVNEGDVVMEGQAVLELETDKVSMEVCAHQTGIIRDFKVAVGDDINTDMVLATIEPQDAVPQTSEKDEATSAPNVPDNAANTNPNRKASDRLSPAVKRLLQENKLQASDIAGTGRDGRITREDVTQYLQKQSPKEPNARSETKSLQASSNSAAIKDTTSTKVPHSRIRKSIAEHMVTSLLHTSPHVTSVFELDMSQIIAHRKWHKKACERDGINLTFTAYFALAAALAAKDVPEVNARYYEDHLELFDQVHMGIGTALGDQGLVVPVIRHVDSMSLYEIAANLTKMTEQARHGQLTPDALKGSTLTISNHGVSGSLFATPIIINQPEVAILGIGKMQKRPVVIDNNGTDELVIRPMCYVSLTIDHRALDAHQTNKFLSRFVEILETWEG